MDSAWCRAREQTPRSWRAAAAGGGHTCGSLRVALLFRALRGPARVRARGAQELDPIWLVLLPLEHALQVPRDVKHLPRLQEALVEAEAHGRGRGVLFGHHHGDHRGLLPAAVRHRQRELRHRLGAPGRLARTVLPDTPVPARSARREQARCQQQQRRHAAHDVGGRQFVADLFVVDALFFFSPFFI